MITRPTEVPESVKMELNIEDVGYISLLGMELHIVLLDRVTYVGFFDQ